MKKIVKKVILAFVALLIVIVLGAGGYVGYVILSYNRKGDVSLDIDSKSTLESMKISDTYKITSYNIGFGAYSQDFSFFLDTGYDENGEVTCGYNSKAKSKEEVVKNITGSINVVKSLDCDFVLLQEVDIKSTRSHKVNQNEMFEQEYSSYDNVFACNFDTAFLPYPLYDMHGKSLSGISTFSKYQIKEASRVEYTISESFSKFFDLDRCFSVSIVNVENGKKLYLINSHMSAYDKGGVIREQQVNELNEFLTLCKSNDDYVIVGGDFNHDLLTYNPEYNYTSENRAFGNTLKDPDWVSNYFDQNGKSPLVDGYKVVASDNVPTCRNNDFEWQPGRNYVTTVDGFIVSDNIQVIEHYNVQTNNGNLGLDGFAFSDHQPAYMEFKLI